MFRKSLTGQDATAAASEVPPTAEGSWVFPSNVVTALGQLGTLVGAISLVYGFGLTMALDPNHVLSEARGRLVFFGFFAAAVLFLGYVLWVSMLMIRKSRHFPMAWKMQALPLTVWLLVGLTSSFRVEAIVGLVVVSALFKYIPVVWQTDRHAVQ